ncbi:phage minor head protein [Anaerophilus nitritogenes]|uniref:phage minor head protein n=1 Tax=Anaerophilus nitritogenes TaxID=2498136 RepID=UPI0013EA60A7|nr:phage minor head protein [Anaerophilus nitritogenes]
MNKKKKALSIFFNAINKTKDHISTIRTKRYLKDLKDKTWNDIAVVDIVKFTKQLEDLFKKHQNAYIKLFNTKKVIYIKEDKKNIKKGKYRAEDYLDERFNHVVVDDIKDELIELEKDFQNELEKTYDDLIVAGTIPAAVETVLSSMGMKFDFNEFDLATRDYLKNKKIHWAKQVKESTENEIKRILVDGFEAGTSTYDIARDIQRSTEFGYDRAEAIARTEIIASCNNADLMAWSKNPDIIGKEWSATGDRRTRPTHQSANGQKRKLEEPFIVGMSRLMHPGDGSLGANAKEIVKCRCTMFPIFKGESTKSNTPYDDKDVGKSNWLRRQDRDFRENYLGGKTKRQLFDAHLLKEQDFTKKYREIDTKDILFINNDCMEHSTRGRTKGTAQEKDFADFTNPKNPLQGGGKMKKGGHSQKNIEYLDKLRKKYEEMYKDILENGSRSKKIDVQKLLDNYTYEYKTYSNGVRVGNVLGHKEKAKKKNNGQTWFPKEWDDDKIKVAGMYVANIKDKNQFWNSNNGAYKHAVFNDVEVAIFQNKETGEIETIFPSKVQSHLEKKGDKLYD